MARSFVTTSAPSGWELGRWTQTSATTWEEQKNSGVLQYTLLSGPATPGSSTVRLRASGGAAEVILTSDTVQVFSAGQYLGEYVGRWEGAGGAAPPPQAYGAAPAYAAAPGGAPPLPAGQPGGGSVAASGRNSKAMPPPMEDLGASTVSAVTLHSPVRAQAPVLDSSAGTAQKLADAAKAKDVAALQQLLDANADPDAMTSGGTALLKATQDGCLPVVKVLLDKGANPTLGKDGVTPMTVAHEKGNKEILNALFTAAFHSMGPGKHPELSASGNITLASTQITEGNITELKDITERLAKAAHHETISPKSKGPISPKGLDDGGQQMRDLAVKSRMKDLAGPRGYATATN